ncbi:MAG: Dyp-type peroxidase [Tetrasphaera sp.]|nr:Dyp-type peroxidase [Tetrasphaera sp.]
MNHTTRRTAILSGLAGLGGVAGAATLAGCTGSGTDGSGSIQPPAGLSGPSARARAFRGARQAGIVEHPQPYAAFVAFTLPAGTERDALRRLLTVWTDDIERLTSGRGTLTDLEGELAAVTARLTVTVGVGRRAVTVAGKTPPEWLAPLPAYAMDRLEARWGEADLILQICADSPTTVAHAQRRLITSVEPLADVRWVQRGFREPFEGPGLPMRNLFGQVDGTVQPTLDGADDEVLFVGEAGPQWLREGSAMVVRRIAMSMDTWDKVDRAGRENAIGRRLDTGGPVTGGGIDAPLDLTRTDDLGFTVVDQAAHVRRAHPVTPHERFLRRPYSYDDAPEGSAVSNSGLIFVAYCADPVRQFVPVQARLAELDLLNIWTVPIGSAVFAALPGARDGEILGQALLS